jgi:hypothetical protein
MYCEPWSCRSFRPLRRRLRTRRSDAGRLTDRLQRLEPGRARMPPQPRAPAQRRARRYGRYLSENERGRPRLDAAKVKAAEKFDGKFVVISNDDTLSAEDIALGYKVTGSSKPVSGG